MNAMHKTRNGSEVGVLFVDDEEKSRKYFSRILGPRFRILLAEDGVAAADLAASPQGIGIGVLVTDQIMPRMTGLDLLRVVSERDARIVRVLSTAYTESGLVEEAVNSGLIDYFVSKPWDIPKLELVVERAVAHFRHNLRESAVA